MAAIDTITALAQSVYLAVKNRYYDDITGADGQVYITNIVDWNNQFLDELELTADEEGNPINWNWLRQMDYALGTATAGNKTIDTPSEILNLVVEPNRYVTLEDDNGDIISQFSVVQPGDINNKRNGRNPNRVARVGSSIYFSRPFTADEDGANITGDVTIPHTRMTLTNADCVAQVTPRQLLVLGIAKNDSLPDIVQGPLSPSFVQKYNDLVTSAIAGQSVSSGDDYVETDDLSSIRGLY